ncbi:MAG: aspartate aminotransferase family protein [bacterium TMED88]|nr:aspartate aminotransferase family protein [Deltaproteobacteria bacterium]OUV32993.1 MAG: aspartate aminotransferase family protein [bacterium TMED88]
MTSPAEAERWKQLDVRHHLNPFSDYQSLKREEGGCRIIERAEGVRLYDVEGRELLDGMSGLWCIQVGYGRPEIVDAVREQMEALPYYNSFFKTTTPPTVELAAKLAQLTPDGLDRAFFGSSGSESNDTVVRLVRWYNHIQGRPEKYHFIGREMGYHGSTMAAASLGGFSSMHEGFRLPLEGFHHVMPPYSFGLAQPDEDEAAFGLRAARAVEEKILELGAENVAAFVGEPVMGAGGLIVPPATYWPEVSRICREHDVLLIVDEVICGFGRTGRWFGSETYDIAPDVMTLAKGITSGYVPLSAVMVSEEICQVLEEEGGEFPHGYTYSGHPTTCAAALANIRLLEDGIVERCGKERAPYFQERVRQLADHPMVGEVRGVGMLAGVELVRDKADRSRWDDRSTAGSMTRDACMRNGIVSRAVGDTMVMAPPLVTELQDIDLMIERLGQSIDEAYQGLRAS